MVLQIQICKNKNHTLYTILYVKVNTVREGHKPLLMFHCPQLYHIY